MKVIQTVKNFNASLRSKASQSIANATDVTIWFMHLVKKLLFQKLHSYIS